MTAEEFRTAFDRCTSHGWLTEDEAKLLVASAERTSGPMVEVGCYMGRSAMLLSALGRMLHCVDPWDDNFSSDYSGEHILSTFLQNMASVPNAVFQVHRMKVERMEPVPAEFVYLDGDHTESGTRNQVKFALKCGAEIIAAHDFESPPIKRACEDELGKPTAVVGRLAVWEL